MPIITIDPDKCTHDGACAAVCPRKLIAWTPEVPDPEPIPGAAEVCIACGHCLAVCPGAAISIDGKAPEECPPLETDKLPDPEAADRLLRGRRSIRIYKKRPVERETIERLLETCRWAPTSSNSQIVHWQVLTKPESLKALAQQVVDWMASEVASGSEVAQLMNLGAVVKAWSQGQDRIMRGAPCLLITHAPQDANLPQENCAIALTYLDLAAFSLGLGTCWVGYLMRAAAAYQPLQEALQLPAGHSLFGAMLLGYPKYSYRLIPPRQEAKVVWD